MSSSGVKAGSGPDGAAQGSPGRWRALAVLCLLQFMLVVDVTIVNIALPRIETELGFSKPGLAWVVNAYVLMAGGLLLLGGRVADIVGRRLLFLTGVALFGVASVVCGSAVAEWMLVAGRFAQGTGEAMAIPASLGLIALLFPDQGERTKALGMWGGVTGIGGVSGTIISGLLVDLASWRWIFLINVPVVLFVLVAVPRLVDESRMVREGGHRIDYVGAVTVTGGLVAIVYGLLQAALHPWASVQVLGPLAGGLALLAATVVLEARAQEPLIPLSFFANRTRVTANIVTLIYTSAFFGYVFLLTLFIQQVLDYSPLRGGLAYLPLGVGIGGGVGLATGLMPRVGVKPVLATGFFGAAVGLLMTSRIHVDASYLGDVMPGMLVLGFFLGMTVPATINASLHGVTGQNSGLASGVQSTTHQLGGALGLACLVTLALRHAEGRLREGATPDVAVTDGYALAFLVGAVLLALAGVLSLALLERVSAEARTPGMEITTEPSGERS